LATKRNSRF